MNVWEVPSIVTAKRVFSIANYDASVQQADTAEPKHIGDFARLGKNKSVEFIDKLMGVVRIQAGDRRH